MKVYISIAFLVLSGCRLIQNHQQPLWNFVIRNDSKQTISDIKLTSLGGSTGCNELRNGFETERSIMGGLDPTWYITFQFTTPDGEVHKKSFIRLIPWRYWEETALGDREVRFSIKEGGVVVAELSGSPQEELDKFYREHPEAR